MPGLSLFNFHFAGEAGAGLRASFLSSPAPKSDGIWGFFILRVMLTIKADSLVVKLRIDSILSSAMLIS
jgi:hypothetical protein